MSLIQHKTQGQADQAWKESLVLRAAEGANYQAGVLQVVNHEFWNTLPTDRLLLLLNADVPATLATFAANTMQATAINASLEEVKDVLDAQGNQRFPKRAPTEPGRSDIVFNGEAFVYVAPQVAEESIQNTVHPLAT